MASPAYPSTMATLTRRLTLTLGALAALATVACSSSTSASSPDAGAGADSGVVSCETDPRVATFAANMSAASPSGGIHVTIVSGTPAPPAKGNNTWTVKVTDGSGAPLDAPDLAISLFMPDHGHGTSIVPTITSQGGGMYSITPLYLFMPGVWRIGFAVDADAGANPSDTADFFFCIEG